MSLILATNSSLKLEEALATDHSYCDIVCDDIAEENIILGELIYYKSDSKWYKAGASSSTTSDGLLAIAVANINATASGVLLLNGFFRDDSWDWVTASGLYISETTSGAMTQVLPDGVGEYVRKVGYAFSADVAYFGPDITIVGL
jgi:hypothetical protein